MTRRERSDSPLWKLPVDQEVHEELDFHLEMRVRQYMDEGLSEADAREKAAARFGDAERLKRACARLARERNRREHFRDWWAEARVDSLYAFRQMRRNPLFALTVILVLAFGLGANVAVFRVVDEVLLQPLGYSESSRLMTVWEEHTTRSKFKNVVNPANFLLFREESQTMNAMAAFITIDATLTGDGMPPLRARARIVTDGYFSVLGTAPIFGRAFDSDDYDAQTRPVVLSHRLWQSRFGGRADIVSQTLSIDGKDSLVVGVMPAGFDLDMGPAVTPYGDAPDFYWPLPEDENWRTARGRWLMIVARLSDGASAEEARAEMALLSERMLETRPDYNANWRAHLVPLETHLNDEARAPLTALSVAVALILLIVCVNVASLLSARAASRQNEISIRTALGAGRMRLVRQLFTESLLTTTLALMVGIGIAALALPLLRGMLPGELDAGTTGIATLVDGRLFVVAVGLLAVCTMCFGILPGLLATRRIGLARRDGSASAEQHRLRSALVFSEVVLAVILLVGSGLLLQSFWRLLDVNPGFDGDGVVTFGLSPSRELSDPQLFAFYDQLLERLGSVVSVESVGAVSHVPIASVGAATSYFPTDRPEPQPGEAPGAVIRVIRGGYLTSMRIPVLEGRGFDRRDGPEQAMGSVIVNRHLAETQWPGASALGKRMKIGWGESGERQIVGVVADVLHAGPATETRDAIYFPHDQERETSMMIVIRASSNVQAVVAEARSLVHGLDPALPLYDVQTMEGILGDSVKQDRALAWLTSLLAGVALFLAGFGIYGMTAYSVAERASEFGLRMALGASPSAIGRMVVEQVARLAIAALAVGVAVSFFGGHLLESLLFEVDASDVATYVWVALALGIGCLLATFVPALRASRLAPVEALRHD